MTMSSTQSYNAGDVLTANSLTLHVTEATPTILTAALDANSQDITAIDEIGFVDAAANATTAGRIRRNGATITFHNGTVASALALIDVNQTWTGAQTFSPATQSGSAAYQVLAADVTFGAGYGSSTSTAPVYGAPIMGNVSGSNLTATANIIGGLIGKYSITGTNASSYPLGALIGEVDDNTTTADAAVIAVLGGDSATTTANAAFGVDILNSVVASGFTYGLDLYKASHDGYLAATYANGAIRLPNANWIVGRNNADSANINMFRVTTGDLIAVGAGLQFGTTTTLVQDADNSLAIRSGTADQSLYVYDNFTNASNYARGRVFATSADFVLTSESAGSGVAMDVSLASPGSQSINFRTNSSNRWRVNSSGHLLAVDDDTYDIGASGATRPRSVYVGTSAVIGTASTETGSLTLANATSASTTTFQAGNATEANTYVWPVDGGAANQVLTTDGATPTTALSWTTVSSVSAATQAEMETATSTTVYASPGRVQYHPGVAKSWNQHSDSGAVGASYNVASITDTGVGDHTVNLTTGVSNVANMVHVGADTAAATHAWFARVNTTSYDHNFADADTTFGAADPATSEWHSALFGDQ